MNGGVLSGWAPAGHRGPVGSDNGVLMESACVYLGRGPHQ